jgi:hypothetical protein
LITCSQRRRQRRRPLLHWKLLPQPQRPQLPKVIRPMTRKIRTEKIKPELLVMCKLNNTEVLKN